MSIKEELTQELEITRQNFHHLLDSVPEALYSHPSGDPAWKIRDVLYHITVGLPALRFEIWMMRHAHGIFQLAMNDLTSMVFNKVNALFARQGIWFTRQSLSKAYENGHAGMMSSLRRTHEHDFQKSLIYPKSFVTELAGEVSVERLFRYVTDHFDIHADQIKKVLEDM